MAASADDDPRGTRAAAATPDALVHRYRREGDGARARIFADAPQELRSDEAARNAAAEEAERERIRRTTECEHHIARAREPRAAIFADDPKRTARERRRHSGMAIKAMEDERRRRVVADRLGPPTSAVVRHFRQQKKEGEDHAAGVAVAGVFKDFFCAAQDPSFDAPPPVPDLESALIAKREEIEGRALADAGL